MAIQSLVLEIAIYIAFASLAMAFLATLFRLYKGPEITDRLIVIDLSASSLIGLIIMLIIVSGETVYLNVALITALVMFMGNIAFARYLRKTLKK
ncbi:MAG: monovalent cation/H+ antiporter complex subunit F [Bacteroidales bacterium]|nr:monovalent cation/H+ antiporter complex subunit F [Bacteroidales bacterium]